MANHKNKSALLAAVISASVIVLMGGLTSSQVQRANAQSDATKYGVKIVPEWTDKDELIRPKNFRATWVFLGSPLTPNSLNDGKANFPEYHNVYVQPSAFQAYRETGKWPEGTMMLKELQLVDDQKGDEDDGSRYEPSGRGFFPGPVNGIDIAVKDSSKFKDSKNWGYFNFGHHAPPYKKVATVQPVAACAQCHIDNASEDMVYIKMYRPILTPLPEDK